MTTATTNGTETKPEEPGFKIEIAVCENIDRSIASRKEAGTYHVEVRFIPSPGAHSLCFQGERFRERAKAEAQKTYVESVFNAPRVVAELQRFGSGWGIELSGPDAKISEMAELINQTDGLVITHASGRPGEVRDIVLGALSKPIKKSTRTKKRSRRT